MELKHNAPKIWDKNEKLNGAKQTVKFTYIKEDGQQGMSYDYSFEQDEINSMIEASIRKQIATTTKIHSVFMEDSFKSRFVDASLTLKSHGKVNFSIEMLLQPDGNFEDGNYGFYYDKKEDDLFSTGDDASAPAIDPIAEKALKVAIVNFAYGYGVMGDWKSAFSKATRQEEGFAPCARDRAETFFKDEFKHEGIETNFLGFGYSTTLTDGVRSWKHYTDERTSKGAIIEGSQKNTSFNSNEEVIAHWNANNKIQIEDISQISQIEDRMIKSKREEKVEAPKQVEAPIQKEERREEIKEKADTALNNHHDERQAYIDAKNEQYRREAEEAKREVMNHTPAPKPEPMKVDTDWLNNLDETAVVEEVSEFPDRVNDALMKDSSGNTVSLDVMVEHIRMRKQAPMVYVLNHGGNVNNQNGLKAIEESARQEFSDDPAALKLVMEYINRHRDSSYTLDGDDVYEEEITAIYRDKALKGYNLKAVKEAIRALHQWNARHGNDLNKEHFVRQLKQLQEMKERFSKDELEAQEAQKKEAPKAGDTLTMF